MTVYVLGAGASKHAGYPLAGNMGAPLFAWMRKQVNSPNSYPAVAQFLEETLGQCDNIESLLSRAQILIDRGETVGESLPKRLGAGESFEGRVAQVVRLAVEAHENAVPPRSLVQHHHGKLREALRDWFVELREPGVGRSYACFANHVVKPADWVLTFNYDSSVERELRLTGKWDIGDGYGFDVDGFPRGSVVNVLKLHGSAGWLALASGLPAPGSSKGEPRVFADPRPAFPSSELEFLGYRSVSDPMFPVASPVEPLLIMPDKKKRFWIDTGGDPEWGWFWQGLWDKAADALRRTDRIVICGYSMPAVDEMARDLLLDAPNKSAEIVVLSGKTRTKQIVDEYQRKGYARAVASRESYFEDWVVRTTC